MNRLTRRGFSLLAILLVIASSLIACSRERTSTTGGTALHYKLAVMVPETGKLAFIGQPMRNALMLAGDDMKGKLAEAGIDVTLVFGDTQGDPREAVTQFQRIADIERANGIITTLSGVIGAISPLAAQRDILLVGLTPDPSFLSITPNGLRVLFSFDKEGEQLAQLINRRGWKHVLILHSTDSATTYEVTKVLMPQLQKSGVSMIADTFTVGQRDFKDLCTKYSGDKWDGIVLHGFGSELPFLAEACAAYPNLAGPPKLTPLSTLDVKPELRKNLSNAHFFAPAFLAKGSPEYQSFSARYEAKFPGSTFTYSSVYAYDAYVLIVEALLKKRSTSATELKAELMTPKKALTQEYAFSANGDFHPDTMLMRISSDGKFEPAEY